jgi:hypothetical protein
MGPQSRNLVPVPETTVELPDGPFDVPVARSGLTIPRIRVVPAAGDPYTVQVYNPDLLLYEETAATHRWKGPGDAPFRWLTFLAWAASRRTGVIGDDVTWESFRATTLEIVNVDSPPADPTRPGVVPG